MNNNSLYNILEIEHDSTQAQIKKAYYKLALEHHPDRNYDLEQQQKFKAINWAYHVLTDSFSKQVYDELGEQGLQLIQ